ncbi:hypothetical protein PI87_12285 [Ralstonia sp. A12]|uniref:hypothetical protein n=1 Tax=Ralstonia sp. A12 TaxID=1217052 RepID=UPI000574624B|nr:hypothetical protein [Ralstonia sp. A12]KHK55790.1 hypothetical protein PI87_12285 [Ralstonia sp. A12]
MYSIDLGTLKLEFESARVMVPRDGVTYDWFNNDWIDTQQQIEIEQSDGSAMVTGLTGRFTQRGPYRVGIVTPRIDTEQGVIEYLQSKPPRSELATSEAVQAAVKSQDFHWGKLLSLDWTALGYAPGGTEYCLLPAGGPAISVDLLRLDWATVRVVAVR